MDIMDTVTVAIWNIEQGGVDGEDATRWRDALEILRERGVDLALIQEVRGDNQLPDRTAEAERILDAHAVLAPNGSGRFRTAVFARRALFDIVGDPWPHPWPWKIPPTDCTVRLRDAPDVELTVISIHLAFAEPLRRELETQELQSIMDKMKLGRFLIMGGDTNEYPQADGETVPAIDWSTVTDIGHREQRARLTADGTYTSITQLDDMMLRWQIPDVARYAARERGQRDALATTAGHTPTTAEQGGPSRVDRIYLDPRLLPAMTSVDVIQTDLSDHHAVMARLDTDGLVQLVRDARSV